MKLYSYWRSSCSWRVRIGLLHKKVAFDLHPINLVRDGGEQHEKSYLSLNPLAQVPTLEFEKSGHTVRITQSLPILEYLDEAFGGAPILPKEPLARATARQLAELVNSGIQPLQNRSVILHVKNTFDADEEEWCQHFIARGLAALERFADRTAGDYLVGNDLSLADMCLVPQLYNARRYHLDVSLYPTLKRIEDTCMALDAFSLSHPDRQPDKPSST